MPLHPHEGRLIAARGAPPRRARVLIRRADSLAPKRLCFGTEGIQTICVLALEAPKRLCFGTLEAPKRLCMGALEACTRFWAPWKHPNDCVWAPWKHPNDRLGLPNDCVWGCQTIVFGAAKRLCLGALGAPKRSKSPGLLNDRLVAKRLCSLGSQAIVFGAAKRLCLGALGASKRSLGSQAIVSGRPRGTQTIVW